jgi:hypothetical protein
MNLLLALWLLGADANDPNILMLMEPWETVSGQDMTSQNGELFDCTVEIVTESGHNYELVFPAPQPTGSFVHTVDLSQHEGKVKARATCRRRMGTVVSEPSPPSEIVEKELTVEPPNHDQISQHWFPRKVKQKGQSHENRSLTRLTDLRGLRGAGPQAINGLDTASGGSA